MDVLVWKTWRKMPNDMFRYRSLTRSRLHKGSNWELKSVPRCRAAFTTINGLVWHLHEHHRRAFSWKWPLTRSELRRTLIPRRWDEAIVADVGYGDQLV